MPQYKVKPRRNHFQTRNPRTCREIFASKPDASTPHCSHGSVRAFPTQPPTRQKEPVRDNSRIAPTDPRGHMHARAIRQPQRHRLSLRFRQGESPERRSLRSQCRHAEMDGGGAWLDARSQPPQRCARRGHARTCEPVRLRARALAGSSARGLVRLRARALAGSCARFFSKCCGRRVRQGPPVSRGHLRSGKTHDRIQRRLSACPSNATFGKESHREQARPDQPSPTAGKATIDFGALHRFPLRRACVPIAVSTVAGARAHAADPG